VRFPRATHLVIMARYIGPGIRRWVVQKLEGELGLRLNREKTGIVRMKVATGAI